MEEVLGESEGNPWTVQDPHKQYWGPLPPIRSPSIPADAVEDMCGPAWPLLLLTTLIMSLFASFHSVHPLGPSSTILTQEKEIV